MRILKATELFSVTGGLSFPSFEPVTPPPHDLLGDAIDKLTVIQNGLSNGDSWATIGKNIKKYFTEKYEFVDKYGR